MIILTGGKQERQRRKTESLYSVSKLILDVLGASPSFERAFEPGSNVRILELELLERGCVTAVPFVVLCVVAGGLQLEMVPFVKPD